MLPNRIAAFTQSFNCMNFAADRKKAFCRLLPYSLLIAWCFSSNAGADIETASEYDLKAAFLYNFSLFVSWPKPASTFNFCVYGNNPFDDTLEVLASTKSKQTDYRVHYIDQPSHINICQILFISRSESQSIGKLSKSLAKRPVLTVTDLETGDMPQAMINIHQQQDRLSFDINRQALLDAGLNPHAKLLTLAHKIR